MESIRLGRIDVAHGRGLSEDRQNKIHIQIVGGRQFIEQQEPVAYHNLRSIIDIKNGPFKYPINYSQA